MSDTEARTKLRELLLPDVAQEVTKSGYVGDYDLVCDEKGVALTLAGEPKEIAKAAEIADGSFRTLFHKRVRAALSETVPWRPSDDDEESVPCECEMKLTPRAQRIMAEIEARWAR